MHRKRIGIISYNIHCNFTNYGSALQSWALNYVIKKMGYFSKLVDYCPYILKDKDPLNPFKNMWDKDDESRLMCELTMPAIKKNYKKFDGFYNAQFVKTKPYIPENFNDISVEVDSFVCGSDTIFCPDEFGIDDGYYANFSCMKNNAVAYAASFGDPHFTKEGLETLNGRLKNFKALGLRENLMIPYVKRHTKVPVQKVLDPTLLLRAEDFDKITAEKQLAEPYVLLYARRYNPKMEVFAEKIASENNLRIVEISLRANNSEKGHVMRYDAGVEEFLSLVKHAKFVVTNSFHGMIFSVQFLKPFVIFSREQCDTKIIELLDMFGLSDRMLVTGEEKYKEIDYAKVHSNLCNARKESLNFLKMELGLL